MFKFVILMFMTTGFYNAFASNPENLHTEVDEIIARYVEPDGPGCVVAIVRKGEILYQRSYGMMNLEYDLPVNDETVFNLGSVSKQFTAASILLLANDDLISLDDEIHSYLPDWPDYGHKITIRHLLHHTSGIVDYDWLQALAGWKETSPGREFTIDMVKRVEELNFVPGEAYYYSNTGYLLLAMIVERVSGIPFSAFVRDNIFKPLEMDNTIIHDNSGIIIKDRADSYMKTDDGSYIGLRGYQSTLVGDNNVYTNITDMMKWDKNFRKPGIGGKDFADQMFTRGVLNNGDTTIYAMGLVVEHYRGLRSVSHGGLTQGYKSHYLQFPDLEFSVICLANALHTDVGRICRSISDIYLDDQFPEETIAREIKKDDKTTAIFEINESDLKEYSGRYGVSGNLVMILSTRGNKLYGQVPGQPEFQFYPKEQDIFFLKVVEAEGHFQRDSMKQINGLLWHQGGYKTPMTKMEGEVLNEELLNELSGVYYSSVLQTVYRVDGIGGIVWLTMPEMPEMLNISRPALMNHIRGHSFTAPYGIIEFTLNEDETVSGFYYENPSAKVKLNFVKHAQ